MQHIKLPLAILLLSTATGFYGIFNDNIILIVLCHFLAGASGYLYSRNINSRTSNSGYNLILSLTVPIIGGLLCACFAYFSSDTEKEGLAMEYATHINPEEYRELFAMDHSYFKPSPEKLTPLADIIHSNAPLNEKRVAIEALAQMETPEAVATLRTALKLDSVEVRFFAASVLSKLEDSISRRLLEYEEMLENGITEPGLLIDIAQSYFDYAYFGLAEGDRKTKMLRNALTHAKEAQKIENSSQIQLLIGRSLLELGRFNESREAFTDYLEMTRNSTGGLIWRAEASYNLGDLKATQRDCQRVLESDDIPQKLFAAVNYWAGGIE